MAPGLLRRGRRHRSGQNRRNDRQHRYAHVVFPGGGDVTTPGGRTPGLLFRAASQRFRVRVRGWVVSWHSRSPHLAASAPATPAAQPAAAPIALHPDNPHYFLWRGRPTILITSAEHYGAVMNLDFDYRKYLDTLAADGMNYTRVFSGAYVEPQGAFKIERNTLAPGRGRFLAPGRARASPGIPTAATSSISRAGTRRTSPG